MSIAPMDLAKQWLSSSPYVAHLGMKVVSIEPDLVRIDLPFTQELVTIGDVVHGGAISSLIDTAAAAAAWSGASEVESPRGTTISISVAFTEAARASDVSAEARVTRRGKSISFIEVTVTDQEEEVVAKGIVAYKIG